MIQAAAIITTLTFLLIRPYYEASQWTTFVASVRNIAPWAAVRVYASLAECEAASRTVRELSNRKIEERVKNNPDSSGRVDLGRPYPAWRQSRCIPSDLASDLHIQLHWTGDYLPTEREGHDPPSFYWMDCARGSGFC